MSLTKHLNDKTSPVRQFLDQRFPNTRNITRVTNGRLKELMTFRQYDQVPYGTIGTALDYRIRYFFAITPSRDLVAYLGAIIVSVGFEEDGSFSSESQQTIDSTRSMSSMAVQRFFHSLDKALENLLPPGRFLDSYEEEELLRYCIVLALFEQCARATPSNKSPLFTAGEDPTVEQLLGLAQEHWVDDLYALTTLFIKKFEGKKFRQTMLNPVFRGGRDVDGADADLILDGCLIDIKTTIHPKITKLYLYQLFGYALLDYDDTHKIRSLGLYMSRQNELLEWTVLELLNQVMDGNPPSLNMLRAEFQQVVKSDEELDEIMSEMKNWP